ncbi:MAG: sterol desaturase family protein [Dokdonella sp.]
MTEPMTTALASLPLEWMKGSVFVALIVALFVFEAIHPRRSAAFDWKHRLRNLGLIAVSTIALRLIYPIGAIGFAATWNRGLFHSDLWQSLSVPAWVTTFATIMVLDFAIYWQHRAFHAWPWFWRAHRVHHTDILFDTTLGVRFHPFEILPSYAWKLLIIALLGAASTAVAIYEATLLAFSLFSHANISIPSAFDRALRKIVITPDWHRVHHSVHRDETNSNFGNFLSIWDRSFGTAKESPRDGHLKMHLGLEDFRSPSAQRLLALLWQPLVSKPTVDLTSKPEEPSHA